MYRPSPCRWLPAVAVAIALPVISFGQPAFPNSLTASEENTSASTDLPSNAPAIEPRIQLPHEQMGDVYSARMRYQAALSEYKQVHPPTAVTWNKMAIAYEMLFDSKDAIRCYKQSIRLNGSDARVYNNLATVYDSLKNYKQGERVYKKALKLNPDSALTLKNLGTNLLMQHKYKGGHEAYAQALSIEPEIFQSHGGPVVNDPSSVRERSTANYFKALSCAHAGLPDCALEYLRQAVNEGGVTSKELAAEVEFAPLRSLPTFKHLLAIAK
jgi:tetratricopeptide (TPR) repeat protein